MLFHHKWRRAGIHTCRAVLQQQYMANAPRAMPPRGALRPVPHGSAPIISFKQIEAHVRREMERSAAEQKISLVSLPRFGRILNGLRPSELTVFTGPTGCGKTTVLSQMSLDYATQGVRVLWGSFEIRNMRLAEVMLQQVVMQPIIDEKEQTLKAALYETAAARLGGLPISFMNLFGSTGLETVLQLMEAAMRGSLPHGAPDLIILDNLQFMLSGQGAGALDRWELMDRAVAAMRDFCNSHPVHVVLVVHPRKEIDDTALGLASVSGTAKATQEADNVIILQKLGRMRFLEVKKNRYHGELGRVQIGYLSHARTVVEMLSQREQPPPCEEGSPETDTAPPRDDNHREINTDRV